MSDDLIKRLLCGPWYNHSATGLVADNAPIAAAAALAAKDAEIARLRGLLGRYVAHVVGWESVDYLDGIYANGLTPDEVADIRSLCPAAQTPPE